MGRFDSVLITGAAGFIGHAVAKRLLSQGVHVVAIDNVNDYYDVNLKRARLAELESESGFEFHEFPIEDHDRHMSVVELNQPRAYVHLAAQAGVRYSIENPAAYIQSNLVGFGVVLEACRAANVGHLVYASSSSVYGANVKVPYSTKDSVDHPLSLYAATKKSNELLAHTYSHIHGIPTTGLRFFTVYGPWGRPDMAIFKFAKAIIEDQPIDVYNFGKMRRDFTYIDDIVDGVVKVIERVPDPIDSAETRSSAPYAVYNMGASQPVELLKMIEVLETAIGKRAVKNLLPMQPGDVLETFADVEELNQAVGFQPRTTIDVGIPHFVNWFRKFYY